MQNADRLAFVAALLLAVWYSGVRCPTSIAEDALAAVPAPRTGSVHRLPDVSDGEFTLLKPTPSTSEPTRLIWTERISSLVRGRAQLEGGYSFIKESVGTGDATQHAFPDLLLRFGLTNRLELRLGWPGYVTSDTTDPSVGDWFSGTLDPNVGLMYDLWPQRGLIPQTAVLAAVPVQLQGNPFALNSLQPLTELIYSWQTSDRTALTGRSGFAIFNRVEGNYTQFQQSLSFDAVLTDRLGVFVSWDMLANHGSLSDVGEHMAGGGFSLLLTERLSVSWRSAVGLNSPAPDFLTDIRFAYRF